MLKLTDPMGKGALDVIDVPTIKRPKAICHRRVQIFRLHLEKICPMNCYKAFRDYFQRFVGIQGKQFTRFAHSAWVIHLTVLLLGFLKSINFAAYCIFSRINIFVVINTVAAF